MFRILPLFTIILLLVSCGKKDKPAVDVSDIEITLNVQRFEQDFYEADASKLPALKEKYPQLFPANTPDSVWIAKMNDADERELFREVNTRYVDFRKQAKQLEDLFKHVKYYYPTFKEPEVFTVMSNVDYQRSVIYAKNYLFISLDSYLGKDSKIYQDYHDYIKQNFTRYHLIVDVAKAFAQREVRRTTDRTFVSRMIQKGKLLYLTQSFLPKEEETNIIGYTQEQLDWADFNDVQMWKYFVEKELLFSNDQELNRRFLDNAPFSKFYSAQDNETPGRIGAWFGLQIVKSYMSNNNVDLLEMLQVPNEELFKASKYKPTK